MLNKVNKKNLVNVLKLAFANLTLETRARCHLLQPVHLMSPQGLTEPGRLHVAYVISTITYSGEYDNFTDPNNGTRLSKTSDNFHTSFYFYVPGLLRSARLDAFNLSLLSTPI